LRRQPLAAADEMLAAVCHRAAFIAAAYANDLDFAFRALATGGAPYLFGTDHAKAMTAIWIRLGHRQEATRWLRRAEQEAAFWSSGSVQQEDQQMADLRAVFAQSDLAPLDQSGIGADFFAKSERPVFFRYSPRFSWTLKPTYWGSTMLYLPVLLFAALIADSTAATVLLPPAIFLVIAMRSFRYGLWMLLNGAAIEFGREGIRYRIGPRLRWVPWSAIQRYGRICHFLTCPGLVVSRDAIRRAGGSQRELAFIPTGNFKRAWPAADLDSELRRHLPHLFAPANGSD
jgi:hypothetical protein